MRKNTIFKSRKLEKETAKIALICQLPGGPHLAVEGATFSFSVFMETNFYVLVIKGRARKSLSSLHYRSLLGL